MRDGEAQGGSSGGAADGDQSVAPAPPDAGAAILTALRAVAERMSQLETAALADEPDAVHQLRTHVRRLRSLLAAYGPLFDASVVTGLRRRYRTFGRELGVVRDLEVRVQVAEGALEEAAEEGVISDAEERDAVQARLIDAERASHSVAHARLAERERSTRADARRNALQAFLDDPPRTALAEGPAVKVLGSLLELEARRAVRRTERLDHSTDTGAVMYPSYQTARCTLATDDKNGIAALY